MNLCYMQTQLEDHHSLGLVEIQDLSDANEIRKGSRLIRNTVFLRNIIEIDEELR